MPRDPKVLHHIPDKVPQQLREIPQWVLWRYEVRDGRSTKIPYQASGVKADVSDPLTWSSYEALFEVSKTGKFNGLGFVLTGDNGIIAWDLDHCMDAETGVIADWARDIVAGLSSYTEITPSGAGLRILHYGVIPERGRKKGDVECYSNKRYVTITGNHLPGTPTNIEHRTDDIWQTVFGSSGSALTSLLRMPRGADLWNGQWQKYFKSQSEADLALCRMLGELTNWNAKAIDELFRRSKLMRSKWDERHFADGRTYGQGTIDEALSS